MDLDALFRGLFDTDLTVTLRPTDFLLCLFVSLLLGAVITLAYARMGRASKSFFLTLILLPAAVCTVILAVGGNIGTGVAVAGAFSLVRFRSVPGTAVEICALFLAMTAGLLCGMGYLAFAALFTLILCAVLLLFGRLNFGAKKKYRTLTLTLPEDRDYTTVFDAVFDEYLEEHELCRVKTADLGSVFRLTWRVRFRPAANEKRFLDDLRCLNANLPLTLSLNESNETEL